MLQSMIDAHIHLDMYEKKDQLSIINEMKDEHVDYLISVSRNLSSAKANLALSKQDPRVKPAFGFHPEQPIPSEQELLLIHQYIEHHHDEMVAVGEVGLPFYLRQENLQLPLKPYIKILESFIQVAKRFHKPIILHAVYEDAETVCSLLEQHSIDRAHFHWFKGDSKTIERMKANGYYFSVTPDVVYKEKIQEVVKQFPLDKIMVETDGPWPFDGIFQGQLTHPKMIHQSIAMIAKLKKVKVKEAYEVIYSTTKTFYGL